MAVSHSAQAKNSIGNAILDDIDGDVGAGAIVFMNTAKTATYCTIPLNDPAGTVATATGVLTFDTNATTPISATASGAGTATRARITDNSGDIILDDITVGLSGQEINLSNNVFGAGDTVKITSLTYTPPT